MEERQRLPAELFGRESDAWVGSPFFRDYGTKIVSGCKVCFHFNWVVLEGTKGTIGSDLWEGGGAMICPRVTIGDGSVIGAGSVRTREIASHQLIACMSLSAWVSSKA